MKKDGAEKAARQKRKQTISSLALALAIYQHSLKHRRGLALSQFSLDNRHSPNQSEIILKKIHVVM